MDIKVISQGLTAEQLVNSLNDLRKPITVEVGVLRGATRTHPDSKGNPVHIAQYAIWNEYGVPKKGASKNPDDTYSAWKIPPRPFMRNTVSRFEKVWENGLIQMLTVSKRKVLDAMILLGEKAAKDIVYIIQEGRFAPNAPTTIARKKAKGKKEPDHPLIDDGELIASISYGIQGGEIHSVSE